MDEDPSVPSKLGRVLHAGLELLQRRTLLVLSGLLLAALSMVLAYFTKLQTELVESASLEQSRFVSEAVDRFRTLYTSEVVERVRGKGVEVSHDYADKEGAIPLPATLSMVLGNSIGQRGDARQVKLYSPYPFPRRENEGGLRDEFQHSAWEHLNSDSDTPYYQVVDTEEGPVLRYATADVMRASCVSCHNAHPDTPKSDWREGDVRGVLEVAIPLGTVVAQTEAGLRGMLVLLVGLSGVGLLALALVTARLRRTSKELEDRVVERTADLATANRSLELEVDERKAAEAALAGRAEELARRNEELNDFTHVASHDLQEPLRKLILFSELLRGDAPDELSEDARKDLFYIEDAASRMSSLVNDLLELSRCGQSAVAQEQVDLDACVEKALDAVSVRVTESGAQVTCDRLGAVSGDAALLILLLQNLIGNAIKFRDPERSPVVHVTVERRDGVTIFGVRDNGIGIQPEYADQIFSPFKRLHGRGEYDGTGIGLAICRKTVDRHGGRIWVESTPGEGSHFRFTLHERAPVEPAGPSVRNAESVAPGAT